LNERWIDVHCPHGSAGKSPNNSFRHNFLKQIHHESRFCQETNKKVDCNDNTNSFENQKCKFKRLLSKRSFQITKNPKTQISSINLLCSLHCASQTINHELCSKVTACVGWTTNLNALVSFCLKLE
jgi:hypothetical protein